MVVRRAQINIRSSLSDSTKGDLWRIETGEIAYNWSGLRIVMKLTVSCKASYAHVICEKKSGGMYFLWL